jgi:hypothetical protein
MGQLQVQLNYTDQCVCVLVLMQWRLTKGGLYSENFTITWHMNISSEHWVPVTRSFPKLDCTVYKTRILYGAQIMAWAGEQKRCTSCFAKKERSVSAYCHCTLSHMHYMLFTWLHLFVTMTGNGEINSVLCVNTDWSKCLHGEKWGYFVVKFFKSM